MLTQIEVYDLCRNFVLDTTTPALTQETKDEILGMIRGRNLAALCSVRSKYAENINSASDWLFFSQVEAFFKKNETFTNRDVCEASCISSFRKSEATCHSTNAALDYFYEHREEIPPDVLKVIEGAEVILQKLLGRFDVFLSGLPDRIRLTNGASSTRPRSRSQAHRKVCLRPVATAGSVPYLEALGRFYGVPNVRPKVTESNRVTFVPKNYKTYRTIACEPEGSLPLQLAFDSWAKERLQKWGCDLSDQSRNQRLAYLASLPESKDSIATLDLEAASDTLCYNCVAWLLPSDWFRFLNAIRSKGFSSSFGDGVYSKFSSMGNGATFALESSIFLALALALPLTKEERSVVSVYGDDIIVPSRLAPLYIDVLGFFGFSVNTQKSFLTGPFRESCGEDYYGGRLVTPFYVRSSLELNPDAAHIVNGLARISPPEGRVWSMLRDIVRKRGLTLVPESENDTSGVFITVDACYQREILVTRRWITRFKCYVTKNNVAPCYDARGLFLWHLRRAYLSRRVHKSVSELVTSRYDSGAERKFRLKSVLWHGSGPQSIHLYWWTDYLLVGSTNRGNTLRRDSGGAQQARNR